MERMACRMSNAQVHRRGEGGMTQLCVLVLAWGSCRILCLSAWNQAYSPDISRSMGIWWKSSLAIEMINKLGRKSIRNGSRKQKVGSHIQPDVAAGSLKVPLLFEFNYITLSRFETWLTQPTNEEYSVSPCHLNLYKWILRFSLFLFWFLMWGFKGRQSMDLLINQDLINFKALRNDTNTTQ